VPAQDERGVDATETLAELTRSRKSNARRLHDLH
jgi:hypothetical protein